MKKIALLLTLLLVLFTGCGKEEDEFAPVVILPSEGPVEQPEAPEIPEVTQEEPVVQPETGTMIPLKMGQTYTYDLDGDGVTEELCCSYQEGEFGPVLSVLINGQEVNQYDTRYWSWIQDTYYLVDLYTNDTYQELAILDNGPSDDPLSVFFYYHDGMLEDCGSVIDFVGGEYITIPGDSTVTARVDLSLLQRWWGSSTWILNENHHLQEFPPGDL